MGRGWRCAPGGTFMEGALLHLLYKSDLMIADLVMTR
jgi:hypothetical protein